MTTTHHFDQRLYTRFGISVRPEVVETLYSLAEQKGWEPHRDDPNRKIAFIKYYQFKLAVVFDAVSKVFITAFPY